MRKLRRQRLLEEINWHLTVFWIDMTNVVPWLCLAALTYALFTGGK